jgi:thiosulfate/3-mercaptopyruvate sulfurtransferase
VIPPVVDLAWVQQHRDALVLADVRWYLDGRSGRAAYDAGHLPGAVFVDLDADLAAHGEPGSGRHPLPEPDHFAARMAALGIADGDTVVAYDDGGGVNAARLVWMLRVTGHEAALLDGGIASYEGPLEREAPRRERATFTPRPWPADRLADIDDATDPRNVVVDARDAVRFRGEIEPVDPRAGHIPGAVNLPCRTNLDADGRFLPPDELRRRFQDVGVADGPTVVSYCGSGVTACHNLLALEHAGFAPGRLYPGSWSQYSAHPDLPIATGDRPPRQADRQRSQ